MRLWLPLKYKTIQEKGPLVFDPEAQTRGEARSSSQIEPYAQQALAVWLLNPDPSSMSEAAVSLAVVGLGMAVLRAFTALRPWREARGDRRAREGFA